MLQVGLMRCRPPHQQSSKHLFAAFLPSSCACRQGVEPDIRLLAKQCFLGRGPFLALMSQGLARWCVCPCKGTKPMSFAACQIMLATCLCQRVPSLLHAPVKEAQLLSPCLRIPKGPLQKGYARRECSCYRFVSVAGFRQYIAA